MKMKVTTIAALVLLGSLFVQLPAQAQQAPPTAPAASPTQTQVAPAEAPEQIIAEYHALIEMLNNSEDAIVDARNQPAAKVAADKIAQTIEDADKAKADYLAARARKASPADMKMIVMRYAEAMTSMTTGAADFNKAMEQSLQQRAAILNALGDPKFAQLLDADIENLRPGFIAAQACLSPINDSSPYLEPFIAKLKAYIADKNLDMSNMTNDQWVAAVMFAAAKTLESLPATNPAPATAPTRHSQINDFKPFLDPFIEKCKTDGIGKLFGTLN